MKVLNLTQDKGTIFSAWFRCLYWYQQKLILPRRNKVANGVWLEQIAPAVYIEVIFTLLVGLRFRDDWLEPGRTNPCRTWYCPKVFLGVLGGSYGGDWTSCIAYETVYIEGVPKSIWILKESPRASGLLCPNGSVVGRFCKNISLVSLLRSGVSYPLTEPLQTGWLTRWVWRN